MVSSNRIRLKGGERLDVQDFFYDTYAGFTSFASKYIADVAICEDIVQDVFLAFYEKPRSFENLFQVKSFFYTSIRNHCLDHLKHQKVKDKYKEFQLKEDVEVDFFFAEILRVEAFNLVYKEVNKLPDAMKQVLLLALKDYSNSEIAEQVGIAVSTVKTHKARAYKILRKNLDSLMLFFISWLRGK
ncbi:sigma-70 family RNA polymerase sigma factor [uncultured Sunxiuqinia sp.]|uniref:sigma-70 family RNA polymerase sigma factor n=1 Tax=uncultured Sunxiuqinia sp. TaxID=1573825 RepID=UPI002626F0EA|nr:sigma-70 family RNA polymerase sigma factor [uncultured Sunxiuqinia sp.]